MRAVRVLAAQNMVSYRMPQSLMIKESYPLPPYSTVIGMVHAACGFTSYQPMQVSVQGCFASSVQEVYTRYEFGKHTKYDKNRHNVKLHGQDGDYGMTRGLGSVELLTDVRLILHILPQEDSLCETIAQGLLNPRSYLSLGRWEDLLRIDDVRLTDLQETLLSEEPTLKDSGLMLQCPAWIPAKTEQELRESTMLQTTGTCYRLHKSYEISPLGLRHWTETVSARYAGSGTQIDRDATLLLDRLPVCSSEMPYFQEKFVPVFPA